MRILETPRLWVRELELDDLYALHALCGDPRVMRYVDDLRPYTLERTRRALLAARDSYRRLGFGPWAFICKTDRRLVGYGGLEVLPGSRHPELSYIFAADCWGQGLATEVATALLGHGFQHCGLEVIEATIDPRNHASMRVAEKLGLRRTGEGLDEYGLPIVYYTGWRSGGRDD